RYRGLKVGLAFDCQKVERIPVEELDIPLDRIITESGTY
ncbi:MAG: 5-formyltetrahydrofolate cyclo-ligase, partial [Erysipelotrichaceae bacterium]|nr:5-formyltetrahydrofolate cyclo-ligase [Erysipelotrichaceae bacterium]